MSEATVLAALDIAAVITNDGDGNAWEGKHRLLERLAVKAGALPAARHTAVSRAKTARLIRGPRSLPRKAMDRLRPGGRAHRFPASLHPVRNVPGAFVTGPRMSYAGDPMPHATRR